MGSLPHFLTHGAPRSARELAPLLNQEIKLIGFCFRFCFLRSPFSVASWDLEVPIDVVDVNCQNLPIMVYQELSLPEWDIKINAYMLHLPVSPQFLRGFRPTFLDALSLLSWSLDPWNRLLYVVMRWHTDVDGSWNLIFRLAHLPRVCTLSCCLFFSLSFFLHLFTSAGNYTDNQNITFKNKQRKP